MKLRQKMVLPCRRCGVVSAANWTAPRLDTNTAHNKNDIRKTNFDSKFNLKIFYAKTALARMRCARQIGNDGDKM